MNATLQPLLDRAFHRARASAANTAIADARELAGVEEPFSYEVVVEPSRSLAELAQKILPRLIYHLESRGSHPPAFDGVFLTLFIDDALCFVHARDGLLLLAQAVNKSFDELVAAHGTGELRRALRPDEAPNARPAEPQPIRFLPGKPDQK